MYNGTFKRVVCSAGPKRVGNRSLEEVTLNNFTLCQNIWAIKSGRMKRVEHWTCMAEMIYAYKSVVWKPTEKRLYGSPMHKQDVNVKMDLKK